MLVDVWPGGTLTDEIISAYKEADKTEVIDIQEVVWYRNTNTAMFSYKTNLAESTVHNMLRDLTTRYASEAIHSRQSQKMQLFGEH